MKREIEELQARLNGSESRALRGRTEEGSRSTQALDTVAAALAAVSAPKTQSQQSPAGHTHPAKPAPSAMQAPPASPAKLASRVHITAASPSTAKPVAAPPSPQRKEMQLFVVSCILQRCCRATVAAFSVQGLHSRCFRWALLCRLSRKTELPEYLLETAVPSLCSLAFVPLCFCCLVFFGCSRACASESSTSTIRLWM